MPADVASIRLAMVARTLIDAGAVARDVDLADLTLPTLTGSEPT
jgi:hypothetical protein